MEKEEPPLGEIPYVSLLPVFKMWWIILGETCWGHIWTGEESNHCCALYTMLFRWLKVNEVSPASCDLDPLQTQNRPWPWIFVIWKLSMHQNAFVAKTGEIIWMMNPTENMSTRAQAIHEQGEGGKNGSINYWWWVLPWLVFDVISLEEGPAQKS